MLKVGRYAYSAFVTNLDLQPWRVWKTYQARANVERSIRELLSYFSLNKIPTQEWVANVAFLQLLLLAYNLVRMTMLQAARQQHVPVERISFVAALRWLATARPGDLLPKLLTNPARPGRVEPRCRKRRPKGPYPWLQQSRAILKQLLISQGVAA